VSIVDLNGVISWWPQCFTRHSV